MPHPRPSVRKYTNNDIGEMLLRWWVRKEKRYSLLRWSFSFSSTPSSRKRSFPFLSSTFTRAWRGPNINRTTKIRDLSRKERNRSEKRKVKKGKEEEEEEGYKKERLKSCFWLNLICFYIFSFSFKKNSNCFCSVVLLHISYLQFFFFTNRRVVSPREE